MASVKVPYLVVKPGAGGVPRYFWQPAKALRQAGWRPQRIPDNWAALADPIALEAAAIAKAKALNEEVVAWRSGEGAPGAAALARKDTFPPGSLGAVIASYKLSRFFTTKAASTQRVYKQQLEILERWSVNIPARAITPKSVQELYETLHARTPGLANNVIRMLRIVMEHARRENLITVNPAAKPGLIGLDQSGRVWPREAVDLFVKHADAAGRWSIGTAVLLNEWLGQRQSDVVTKLRRSVLRNGEFIARQGKTGAGIKLPLGTVARLVVRVQEEIARQDKRWGVPIEGTARRLLINEETGEPWSLHSFRHEFRAIRAAAAAALLRGKGWQQTDAGAWTHPALAAELAKLPEKESAKRLEAARRRDAGFEVDYIVAGAPEDAEPIVGMIELQFMHLRHTAVVRLAEAGCSIALIAAVTGHTIKSVEQILERYLVRTGEMARQAFAMRLAKEQADA